MGRPDKRSTGENIPLIRNQRANFMISEADASNAYMPKGGRLQLLLAP
jgi:hypothetical protein